MRASSRFRAWGVVALLAALAVGPALAQDKAARKEAGARYQRGITLYKDGDYGAALAEFRAAYRAAPSFEVLYNIGLCERRLFKYGEAVADLERYLKEGGGKVPRDRRDAVAKELSEIRALTAEVTITVVGDSADVFIDGEKVGMAPLSGPLLLGPGKKTFKATREGFEPGEKVEEIVSGTKVAIQLEPKTREADPADLVVESSPAGAVVTVDGKLAGAAPVKLSLPPGGHTVVADLGGYQTFRQEVTLASGQKRQLVVALEPEVVAQKRQFPVAGVIVAGVGLGAIGGAVGLNLAAQGSARQVSDLFETGNVVWDANAAAIEASGQRAQTWSIVLGIAGGVALTTGLIMTLVTLSQGGEDAPVEDASLMLTPLPEGGAYGSLRVTF